MLKVRVVSVGRDRKAWVHDGCQHYLKLLSRYARVELDIAAPPPKSSSLSPAEIKSAEAEVLRKKCQGYVVALDTTGRTLDSVGLARWLEKVQMTSGGQVTLLIGGPHGLDQTILDDADFILSLSALTFPHELVRLIALEQLYRGYSILHHTDYHK